MTDEYETIPADEASKILGQALTDNLSDLAKQQMSDNDMDPHDIATALFTVAGNVSAKHLGIKYTAAWLRQLAAVFEDRLPKRLN